jgi:hypothetical protein
MLWIATIGILAVCLARWVRDLRPTAPQDARAVAFAALLTWAITLVLISALGVLTPRTDDGWTINKEATRYLGPVFPFLFVPVAQFVAARKRSTVALMTAVALLLGAASVVAYRVGRMRATLSVNREAYPSGPQMRGELARLHAAVRSGIAAGRPVVYCDADITREYFSVMSGAVSPRGGCSPENLRAADGARALVLHRSDVTGRP